MNAKLQPLKLLLLILCLGCAGTFLNSCDEDEPKTIPVLTTGEATDITTESATVSGEITDDGNSEITVSGFVYSSTNETPTTADSKVDLSDTEGDISTLLEGLSSGTTYHFRAYAINAIGTGYGEVVDFTTGNAAPTATNLSITGEVEANKELTAVYTYSDPESDAEGTSTIQWYVANDATGAGETTIVGATEETYTIQEAEEGKFIRFGVTAKATTGNTEGEEVKSTFVGAVGEATTVTFIYNGEEVTYGIINSVATGKKWLDRNLGAPNTPSAFDDYANYGDLFQWGRDDDGHQLMTRNGPDDADMLPENGTTPDDPKDPSETDGPGHSLFIISGFDQDYDWRVPHNDNLWQGVSGANNLCPSGWRIATKDEWLAENLGALSEAHTKLKITLTGLRAGESGNIFQSTNLGLYWTSTIDGTNATSLMINSSGASELSIFRNNGFACRCIKN